MALPDSRQLLTLLQQALRVAVTAEGLLPTGPSQRAITPSGLPSLPGGLTAARSVGSVKSETPAVAAAGVSGVPSNLERKATMQTVPQPVTAATPPAVPMVDIGSAQHTALLRWHRKRSICDVMDELAANPRFPYVAGNPDAVRFACGPGPRQDGAA